MDYTTLARFKSAEGAKSTSDDAQASQKITDASRTIDYICTGVADTSSADYLKFETKTDELISGIVTSNWTMLIYPRKPVITSISALSWQERPGGPWNPVDVSLVTCDDRKTVEVFDTSIWTALDKVRVKITYSGGIAPDVDHLPENILNLATLLAIRFYKEEKSGLSDAIGVAELGTMSYTKAIPDRLRFMLRPYVRRVPWA